jgi:hypothetical protein
VPEYRLVITATANTVWVCDDATADSGTVLRCITNAAPADSSITTMAYRFVHSYYTSQYTRCSCALCTRQDTHKACLVCHTIAQQHTHYKHSTYDVSLRFHGVASTRVCIQLRHGTLTSLCTNAAVL